MITDDQNIKVCKDIPSGANLSITKISQYRLSRRMRQILVNIRGGIDRGELLSRLYRLERSYLGYWNELCLYDKEKYQYKRYYCSAQAAMTKSLIRLKTRGLVELQKSDNNKVVKKIVLTPTGKRVAEMLANNT